MRAEKNKGSGKYRALFLGAFFNPLSLTLLVAIILIVLVRAVGAWLALLIMGAAFAVFLLGVRRPKPPKSG